MFLYWFGFGLRNSSIVNYNEYINKAIQKAQQLSSYILVKQTENFRYSETQALQKVLSNYIALLDNLALRWCQLY